MREIRFRDAGRQRAHPRALLRRRDRPVSDLPEHTWSLQNKRVRSRAWGAGAADSDSDWADDADEEMRDER